MEWRGHGKTEIYLQLIENVIKQNKTAIVLVPEISLTPQMVERFLARFGDCIAILHSKLSQGERYDEWQKIKENKAKSATKAGEVKKKLYIKHVEIIAR